MIIEACIGPCSATSATAKNFAAIASDKYPDLWARTLIMNANFRSLVLVLFDVGASSARHVGSCGPTSKLQHLHTDVHFTLLDLARWFSTRIQCFGHIIRLYDSKKLRLKLCLNLVEQQYDCTFTSNATWWLGGISAPVLLVLRSYFTLFSNFFGTFISI